MRRAIIDGDVLPENITHIDPDQIAREINPNDPRSVDMQAGREAVKRFNQALDNQQSFTMETTLTGTSVLNRMAKAKEAGYEVSVYHVGLGHPDLNVQRVAARVSSGGHHIDEAVIRRRYHESQHNLQEVIRQDLADNIYVVDNSSEYYRYALSDTKTQGLYVADHVNMAWTREIKDQLEEKHALQASNARTNGFFVDGAESLQANTPTESNGMFATLTLRSRNLQQADQNFSAAIYDFWQAPEMKPTVGKIKAMAEKYGVSEAEVLAKVNNGETLEVALKQEINDVMRDSVYAQKAMNKISTALEDWRKSHAHLAETANKMLACDHPLAPDTYRMLTNAEADLARYARNAPPNDHIQSELGMAKQYIKVSQQGRVEQARHAEQAHQDQARHAEQAHQDQANNSPNQGPSI